MDVISHAAWGATIIRKNPEVWWAAFSGALPDILTAGYGFFKFGVRYPQKLYEFSKKLDIFDRYFKIYYFFHSLVPITVAAIIIAFINPTYIIITIPYYLHIMMDIFTHQGVWATRIFYPISDFHFEGRNWWRNRWINTVNWLTLVIINLIIIII